MNYQLRPRRVGRGLVAAQGGATFAEYLVLIAIFVIALLGVTELLRTHLTDSASRAGALVLNSGAGSPKSPASSLSLPAEGARRGDGFWQGLWNKARAGFDVALAVGVAPIYFDAQLAGQVDRFAGFLFDAIDERTREMAANDRKIADAVADIPVLGQVASVVAWGLDEQQQIAAGVSKGAIGWVQGYVDLALNPLQALQSTEQVIEHQDTLSGLVLRSAHAVYTAATSDATLEGELSKAFDSRKENSDFWRRYGESRYGEDWKQGRKVEAVTHFLADTVFGFFGPKLPKGLRELPPETPPHPPETPPHVEPPAGTGATPHSPGGEPPSAPRGDAPMPPVLDATGKVVADTVSNKRTGKPEWTFKPNPDTVKNADKIVGQSDLSAPFDPEKPQPYIDAARAANQETAAAEFLAGRAGTQQVFLGDEAYKQVYPGKSTSSDRQRCADIVAETKDGYVVGDGKGAAPDIDDYVKQTGATIDALTAQNKPVSEVVLFAPENVSPPDYVVKDGVLKKVATDGSGTLEDFTVRGHPVKVVTTKQAPISAPETYPEVPH